LFLLQAIINIIKRMTVPPVKQTIKNINDSRIVPGFFPLQGLKKDLVDRLIGIFTSLKEGNMSDEYRESRRLLEEQYGTRISIK
jgi:predicted subunit of tRNA(5-methylaminomethyl-2-thiouridylate) methyltransferase